MPRGVRNSSNNNNNNNTAPNVTLTPEQFQQLLAAAQGNNNVPPPQTNSCSYKDFMNCKPSSFKGTEGPVELTRWFEKLESVFRISNCGEANKVKYAMCTLSGSALTWWNSYCQTVGIDAANATPWADVKRMMTEKYCPRNQVQKMEAEFWELRVKNNDIDAYTNRFLELASLCPSMVTPDYKKIERYVEGLPAEIQGNVISAGKESIDGVILLAQDLMMAIKRRNGNKTETGDGKRKLEGDGKSSFPNKKSSGNATGGPSSNYAGKHPYCSRCEKHHSDKCKVVCEKCKKVGHLAKNCRVRVSEDAPATKANATTVTCFGCGEVGHYKSQCPKKGGNGKGNGGGNAKARAFVMTNGEARDDDTDITEEST